MQQIAIRFRTFFADECSFIGIADTVVRAEFQRVIYFLPEPALIFPGYCQLFVDRKSGSRLCRLLLSAKRVFLSLMGKTHSGQPIFDLAVNAG